MTLTLKVSSSSEVCLIVMFSQGCLGWARAGLGGGGERNQGRETDGSKGLGGKGPSNMASLDQGDKWLGDSEV